MISDTPRNGPSLDKKLAILFSNNGVMATN